MTNPYQTVRDFEAAVATYAGSRFAVAVDTGTIAIFLCCKYLNVRKVSIPKHTYLSVPCSIIHSGGSVKFDDRTWSGTYSLDPYPIIDGACRFTSGMYKSGLHCLSFQYRKHLKIGRGGMILTDDEEAVRWLKLARFSGRHEAPLLGDTPEFIGWQAYMEPERAAKGLTLLMNFPKHNEDLKFEYPDLSLYKLYQEESNDRAKTPLPGRGSMGRGLEETSTSRLSGETHRASG